MAERLNGMALLSIATGSVLLYSGVTGKSALATLYAIVSGKSPGTVGASYQITGQDSSGGSGSSIPAAPGSVSNAAQAKQYAYSLFPSYGWGPDQETYLDKLWTRESGWNANAVNSASGAYGIPQALGHGTPFPHGWAGAAASIKWGLDYIKQRYGSPQMAWAHEQSAGWY